MVFGFWLLVFERFLCSEIIPFVEKNYQRPKTQDQRPFLMYQIRKIIRVLFRFDGFYDRLSID